MQSTRACPHVKASEVSTVCIASLNYFAVSSRFSMYMCLRNLYGDRIHLVVVRHFHQGRQLQWLPVCFNAHRTRSEKGFTPRICSQKENKDSLTVLPPLNMYQFPCRRFVWHKAFSYYANPVLIITNSFEWNSLFLSGVMESSVCPVDMFLKKILMEFIVLIIWPL